MYVPNCAFPRAKDAAAAGVCIDYGRGDGVTLIYRAGAADGAFTSCANVMYMVRGLNY